MFDHFHHILDGLKVAFELGFIVCILFSHILLSLTNMLHGNRVKFMVVKRRLQLALLGHFFAEAEELVCALLVVHICDVVVQEIGDTFN